jgi:hypothetical protein
MGEYNFEIAVISTFIRFNTTITSSLKEIFFLIFSLSSLEPYYFVIKTKRKLGLCKQFAHFYVIILKACFVNPM